MFIKSQELRRTFFVATDRFALVLERTNKRTHAQYEMHTLQTRLIFVAVYNLQIKIVAYHPCGHYTITRGQKQQHSSVCKCFLLNFFAAAAAPEMYAIVRGKEEIRFACTTIQKSVLVFLVVLISSLFSFRSMPCLWQVCVTMTKQNEKKKYYRIQTRLDSKPNRLVCRTVRCLSLAYFRHPTEFYEYKKRVAYFCL